MESGADLLAAGIQRLAGADERMERGCRTCGARTGLGSGRSGPVFPDNTGLLASFCLAMRDARSECASKIASSSGGRTEEVVIWVESSAR